MQHFRGVIASSIRYFNSAKHARQFLYSLVFVQVRDVCSRCLPIRNFHDSKMMIRDTRDLRQMGYAKNLPRSADVTQTFADHFRNASTHAAVDFVKYHRRYRAAVAGDNLYCETHTGQFAAGCDFGQGQQWLSRIRADQVFNIVDTVGT